MAETLAEILAEGERLETEYDRAVRDGFDSTAHALWDEKCSFWDDHARTLLAVAKAAVECERDPEGGGFTALRAAVRGADEGGNDGR